MKATNYSAASDIESSGMLSSDGGEPSAGKDSAERSSECCGVFARVLILFAVVTVVFLAAYNAELITGVSNDVEDIHDNSYSIRYLQNLGVAKTAVEVRVLCGCSKEQKKKKKKKK